jgi:hypothetical protein
MHQGMHQSIRSCGVRVSVRITNRIDTICYLRLRLNNSIDILTNRHLATKIQLKVSGHPGFWAEKSNASRFLK